MFAKRHFLLIGFTLLSACSSLKNKADKHFENGEFLAAANLYEQVVKKDSSDAESVARLKTAREHVLNDRLIEVRQLRLADNYSDALTKFEQVLQDEAEWKVSPTGAAFSTQNDEAEYLFKWAHGLIKTDLQNTKPLRAKVYMDRHRIAFASGSMGKPYDSLYAGVMATGVADCRTMKAGGNGPYSVDFVKKYCLVFGDKETSAKVSPSLLKVQGFGNIQLTGAIQGLPEGVTGALTDNLLRGLKQSQFYSATAPPLKVNISGKFLNTYSERASVGVFSYTVDIPYQVAESVPYYERIPYTVMRSETNIATGITTQVPHTEYRDETRYRTEFRTHYRQEPRTLSFPQTEYVLKYEIDGNAAFTLDGVNHHIPIAAQLNMADTYHETSNSSVGLKAKPRDIPSPSTWLEKTFTAAGDEVGEKIASAWDNKYCQAPKTMNSRGQMESVLKCISGSRRVPEFAESWFQNRFGMSFKEVSGLIGRS